MALTDEELRLQINILTSKTSDNTGMMYKANLTLNKGLNPEYFSGNYSKIVNAINLIADTANKSSSYVQNLGAKINRILLDVDSESGEAVWGETQQLMGKPTIIEGINAILKGELQGAILGLKVEDVGKAMSVQEDDNGKLILKAIDLILETDASKVTYSGLPGVKTVEGAIDYILENMGFTEVNLDWENIMNKPTIGNKLVLTDEALTLNEDSFVLSTVPLMLSGDVDDIIDSL